MAKNPLTPSAKLASNARWYARNRNMRVAQVAAYNERNRKTINQKSRRRSKRSDVKEQRNQRQRQRYADDTAFRIYCSVRTRLNKLAKRKAKHRSALRTIPVLGCSMLEFKEYIERQFKRGMSWENYGKRWHLDHKIPCARFDLSDRSQVERCFNFRNYQPLSILDNLRKGTRLMKHEQIPLGLL